MKPTDKIQNYEKELDWNRSLTPSELDLEDYEETIDLNDDYEEEEDIYQFANE